VKSHPLLPHYFRQIESLRSAESALIKFIAWLHRCAPGPGLMAALADIETCGSGRRDCLQTLSHRHRIPECPRLESRVDPFLDEGMAEIARATDPALRQALAIGICSELDRQLINDYRIARGLAARLRFGADARRLDTLLSILADRNLCWKPAAPRNEAIKRLELVSG
jgi:hypothetical protein